MRGTVSVVEIHECIHGPGFLRGVFPFDPRTYFLPIFFKQLRVPDIEVGLFYRLRTERVKGFGSVELADIIFQFQALDPSCIDMDR